ncbi:hypothetical protein ABM000_02910 [Morganella morganii]|uniref:hypothetical protein n=1 Tax=Morganella morganii TaxID=582 RepID=UPI000BC5558D|nr:hypothetical protein [Morganella morganii]AVD59152.1 hypothetical protein C4E49_06880 [Morganella morganii]MBT0337432.1 hypothetical protein [Morganella morganii subsp. morganii]MBT0428222.1 hypothetical protein [Morganella morganii subsp. morganii]MBT0522773.1 hypothetical protein [Morganella morganii subsp. morganii]MCW3199197.1 hypothetical protein [Morganella morganii]
MRKAIHIEDYICGKQRLPKMFRAVPVLVDISDEYDYDEYMEATVMIRRVMSSCGGWRWQVIKDRTQKDIWQYMDDLERLRERFEYHYSVYFI